jgi:protein farnesyltransferase/geranylgeranyltransferase type-1 subunit alpha
MGSKLVDYKVHDWSDVQPIQLDQSGENALGKINYSREYVEATSLLRAIMAVPEYSVRALALTSAVIEMNTAHYTVWEYRLRIVQNIGRDQIPEEEWLVPGCPEVGSWLEEVTLSNPKGYQVWNYREYLEIPGLREFYINERNLCALVIEDDSKNFHAWSHLKWAVSRGGSDVFTAAELLNFTASRLQEDIRNNSAWGFRYFVFSMYPDTLAFEHEVLYVRESIAMAPQNESTWNYLEGLYKLHGRDVAELEDLCREYASVNSPLRSTHAAELLCKILERTNQDEVRELLDLLDNYDPVRKGYWGYKRAQLASV